MTQTSPITNTAWTELGTGLTTCVLRFSGRGLVFMGDSAPALSADGFLIGSGNPIELPAVGDLGGGVWVRSVDAEGSVTYAVA